MRPRHPCTGTSRRSVPSLRASATGSAAAETNVVDRAAAALGRPAQSGANRVGSARSTEAFPSPNGAQASTPALRTASGFTPKNAGPQSTMSAMRPGESEPTSWLMPCVIAGSMVTLAR